MPDIALIIIGVVAAAVIFTAIGGLAFVGVRLYKRGRRLAARVQAKWQVYEPKIAELQRKQALFEANRQQLEQSMASLDASIARLREVVELIEEAVAPVRRFTSFFRR